MGHIAATGAKVIASASAEKLVIHDVVIKTSELRLLAQVDSCERALCKPNAGAGSEVNPMSLVFQMDLFSLTGFMPPDLCFV